MPWWGWLIAGCTALIVVAWVAVTVLSIRAVNRAMETDRWADARRPFGRMR